VKVKVKEWALSAPVQVFLLSVSAANEKGFGQRNATAVVVRIDTVGKVLGGNCTFVVCTMSRQESMGL